MSNLVYTLGGRYNTPASRSLAAGAATIALLWLTKPDFAFREDGTPRTAKWAARKDLQSTATYAPWWAVTALVIVATDLFV